MKLDLLILLAVLACGSVVTVHAQDVNEIKRLSLEDLMDTDVSSVERTNNPLSDTPAAVTVLTSEDIRRSGATSLPELLRYVPGVEVARKDSDHWSVTIRGFGSQFSKDVLVLIDGRVVYTPLFEGVFWDVQDVLPENIQRIEVIRGPGGTIWGANAVNGVISIITKNANLTRGELVTARTGVVDRAAGGVRYGAAINPNTDYRIYGKAFDRGAEFHPDGMNYDQWRLRQSGFRIDGRSHANDSWTLQGDIYNGTTGEAASVASFSPQGQFVLIGNDIVSGGNALGQWERKQAGGGDFHVNAYYDVTNRHAPHFEEHRATFDIDILNKLQPWHRQNLIWGLEARVSPSRYTQTIPTLNFAPARSIDHVYGAFLQDEISFSKKLSLTAGSKFEWNNYTGLELQPGVRLLAKPNSRNTLWASVTRALRTPARVDEDVALTVFGAPGVYATVVGNRSLRAEQLVAYEAGYRTVAGPKLGVDLALFHNDYGDLVATGNGTISSENVPIPHLLITIPWVNGIVAHTNGLEIAPDFRPFAAWRLKASYSFIHVTARNKPGNNDTNDVTVYEGSTPQHLFYVQSLTDLSRRFEFDQTVRYVSALPAQQVQAYVTADGRFSWHLNDQVELSLIGQNLLQPQHAEFGRDLPPLVGIRRTAYVSLRWSR